MSAPLHPPAWLRRQTTNDLISGIEHCRELARELEWYDVDRELGEAEKAAKDKEDT